MNYLLKQKLFTSLLAVLAPFRGVGHPTVLATMTSLSSFQSIDYDELQKNIKNGAYIVDVREKQELLDTGTLPNSVNIPVGEVGEALLLPDAEFFRKYGANKPNPDTVLIFSCRSGRRSEMAAQTTVKLGFLKVLNYSGGWIDWEKNSKSQN